MNTRIRLKAIRPLLLISTFQLLVIQFIYLLSISMDAYVLRANGCDVLGCC